MKTAIVKVNEFSEGEYGEVMIQGTSRYANSRIQVDQHWPHAMDVSIKHKTMSFYNVPPQSIRELRKALQRREAELVDAGYLESEE